MKKISALILIICFSLVLVSCSGAGGQQGNEGQNGEKENGQEIQENFAWYHLRNNFDSLLQSRDAMRDGSIGTFYWNIAAESAEKAAARVGEALEGKDSEEAEILQKVAKDMATLVEKYDDEFRSGGKKADDEALVRQINQGLDKAESLIRQKQQQEKQQ